MTMRPWVVSPVPLKKVQLILHSFVYFIDRPLTISCLLIRLGFFSNKDILVRVKIDLSFF
jgi:hypothetical protein